MSFSQIIGEPWGTVFMVLGIILLLAVVIWLIFTIVLGILVSISIKKKKMYFPKVFRSYLMFMEGAVRVVCQILGVDSRQLLSFLILIDNEMNTKTFIHVPVEKRVVFLPHCLRSSECPARLSPDGIKCISCGKCALGQVIPVLNDAGYKTFIIPGSTFIKRMVKKYHPEAMIGVGCLFEVKEGLEMGRKISLATMGVVNETDGCVETTMDIDRLLEIASLGLDKELVLPPKN